MVRGQLIIAGLSVPSRLADTIDWKLVIQLG
jgi:hypothetical protein